MQMLCRCCADAVQCSAASALLGSVRESRSAYSRQASRELPVAVEVEVVSCGTVMAGWVVVVLFDDGLQPSFFGPRGAMDDISDGHRHVQTSHVGMNGKPNSSTNSQAAFTGFQCPVRLDLA
jgi:hypothetical protein